MTLNSIVQDWSTCVSLNNDNFSQLLATIATEWDEDSPLLKWKSHDNHVVVQTDQYFYKMYQKDISAGTFPALIRESLAKVYRERLGLTWNIHSKIVGNTIYQIEQRQKVKVLTDRDIDFRDVLAKWSITLKMLEDALQMNKLKLQLIDQVPNFYNLKLVRDCVNKFDDYGITDSGDVVLLDDCDWFLAPIDKNNKWTTHQFGCYDVDLLGHHFSFVPNHWKVGAKYSSLVHLDEQCSKWTLLKGIEGEDKHTSVMKSLRDRMLDGNIDVLINPQNSNNTIIAIDEEHKDIEQQVLKMLK